MRLGAIVLCGGRSTRMGMPKADLPFGGESMLARVVRRLAEVADPIVVVTAPGQAPPDVGIPLLVAEDARPGRGPLEGLAAGLRAVAAGGQFADNDAVYATGCDVPLLVPAFVTVLRDRLGDDDVAVPYDGQYHHPLSAIYRIRVLANIDELLSAEELRPTALFDVVPTARVPVDELRTADPQLRTLENLNHPADYLAALAAAGYAPPPGFIERPGGASDTERRRTE